MELSLLEKLVTDVDWGLSFIEEMIMFDDPYWNDNDVEFVDFPDGEMTILPIFENGGRLDEDDPAFFKVRCWVKDEENWGFDLLNLEGKTLLSHTNSGKLKAEDVIKGVNELDSANIVDDFVYFVDLDTVREEVAANPRAMLFVVKAASVLNEHYENSKESNELIDA